MGVALAALASGGRSRRGAGKFSCPAWELP